MLSWNFLHESWPDLKRALSRNDFKKVYWSVDSIEKLEIGHCNVLILMLFFDRPRRQNPGGMLVDPNSPVVISDLLRLFAA